ncbi:TonB-linked SusC/RagA family outer membrane protein [Salinibacter ruber]|uniref:SusC/RagA family TonB-linked outer membrane protein n=1 Tax=Salinibacter ruber TaxID=146919 RepID=UPI0021697CFD|nr:SusC/RagA family TonB-linked outer membrane protein [Salinibacter ruber]MCS3630885.1 TonB-linked SusC/RagA family outer membrane protein [Salinibacter ruber]MCS3640815.1 TonB-linked SusC/RagA family outer membrane protein [Salinibacter ruber]
MPPFISSYSSFKIVLTAVFGVLLIGIAAVGSSTGARAQDIEVSGTVVAAGDQAPLPGVNVREEGTNRGTATDVNGEFTISVSGENAVLVFSFVGFQEKSVPLDGRSELTVALNEQVQDMEEVVVTAFGMEQKRQNLGYSVEDVEGADIAESGANNLGDALQGRVSGVSVQSPATGPGGSSRITIRGNANLAGNDPLYVVDGVPIRNVQEGSAGRFGGTDGGDALSKLNPEDIESMSVLKGGAAAALYGTRAQNGVIVIETKGGDLAQEEYFSAEYSGSVRAQMMKSTFGEFQYEYGQGTNGQPPQNETQALNQALSSWGAPIDEVDEAVQFDGEVRPYEARDENLEEFYDTGIRSEHSIALSRGSQAYDVRMSLSRMDDGHIIPATQLNRTTLNLRGAGEIGNLFMDGKLNYTIEKASFRPELSDNPANPMLSLSFMPTTLGVNTLDPHKDEDGNHRAWSSSVFRPNPYWGMREFERDDQQRRVQGFALARYNFTEDISLQARVGTDWYTLDDTFSEPGGTPWIQNGRIFETTTRRREDNFNVLFQMDQPLTSDVGVDLTLGGNLRYENNEEVGAEGSKFVVPGLTDFNNTQGDRQTGVYDFSEKQVNSAFGSAEFDYREYLYLEITGRNDWSSTLPENNNSFFYPSVSSSFLFTQVLDLPDVLSSGTVRASYAEVGGDTDPYQLALTYGLVGSHPSRTGGTVSRGAIQGGQIPPLGLQPKQKETYEFGTNLQFFQDRLGLDVTWYRENSSNQILGVPVSNTSGFNSRLINAGNIQNQGLEIQLRGTILQKSDYSWNASANFTRNDNEVKELAEGVETEILGQSRSGHTTIQARPGEPYGQIVGPSFERTDEGEVIFGEDGLPIVGEQKPLGNQEEDWSLGLTNTFQWKGVTLQALFDVSWGGDMYSFTNAQAYQTGKHKETLPGREQGYVIGDGVQRVTDGDGNVVELVENDVPVDPEDYYGYIGSNFAEPFVYDASYVRLRQLRLSYSLPQSAVEALPGVSSTRLSLTGRNLWLIYDDVPNVDPSASYTTGAAHGLEHASLPQTRNFGFDVQIRF